MAAERPLLSLSFEEENASCMQKAQETLLKTMGMTKELPFEELFLFDEDDCYRKVQIVKSIAQHMLLMEYGFAVMVFLLVHLHELQKTAQVIIVRRNGLGRDQALAVRLDSIEFSQRQHHDIRGCGCRLEQVMAEPSNCSPEAVGGRAVGGRHVECSGFAKCGRSTSDCKLSRAMYLVIMASTKLVSANKAQARKREFTAFDESD